jgi:hypothetical protein
MRNPTIRRRKSEACPPQRKEREVMKSEGEIKSEDETPAIWESAAKGSGILQGVKRFSMV